MVAYIDGSAHPNPGKGGFGFVLLDNENSKWVIDCHTEQFSYTTNNEMELKAALWCLKNYGKSNLDAAYCDSAYVVNTLTSWMFNWEKKGWIKSDKKRPENLEIIKEYFNLLNQGYNLKLIHIKGHNGIFGNELADLLATDKFSEAEVRMKFGKKESVND